MSSDETFALVVSIAVGLATWIHWYWQCGLVARFGARWRVRAALCVIPPLCLAILGLILWEAAAEDVRYNRVYLLFYMVLGLAWLGVAKAVLGLLGLSARDDVIERGNSAAAWAISGALVGLTLCFAGGNVGDGPGWWVVLFSGGLATTTFFLVWSVSAHLAGWADRITVDRDSASGMRAAGFFVAAGLILGRAVAGDWQSAWFTLRDFVKGGYLALPLALVAMALEIRLRPLTGQDGADKVLRGWLPAIGYLVAGGASVLLQGAWR